MRHLQFACGHRVHVPLPKRMRRRTARETVAQLQHSHCFVCSHALRQGHARQMREAVGLVPLQGDELEQVAYAEEIRLYVLSLLVPLHPFLHPLFESPGPPGGLAQTVAFLNRQAAADFWIERRMVMYEPQRAVLILAELQLDSAKGAAHMIRNGMSRKLAVQAERARLLTQWEAYPQAVQQPLGALLRDYGLQAAALATEAVEQLSNALATTSSRPQVRGRDQAREAQ